MRVRRRQTLRSFLEDTWLPAIKPTIRATTFAGYENHVRNHISPCIGDRPLQRLSPADIRDLYSTLLQEGNLRTKGGLSPSTVKRVHATMHRALGAAVKWELIDSNPLDKVDPPRQHAAPEMRTWTGEQLASFLHSVKDDELHDLWFVLATTGMRRGETLGLRWGDVDLERKTLAVRQSLVPVGTATTITPPKTARGRRVIALDERTVSVLHLRRKRMNGDDGDFVFCDENGRPPDPTSVSKRFAKLVGQAGLPKIRLHDLRHTHATLALEAGIHPKVVSERLGHATVSLTLDVYSHALEHMQHEAATKVSTLVFGARDG